MPRYYPQLDNVFHRRMYVRLWESQTTVCNSANIQLWTGLRAGLEELVWVVLQRMGGKKRVRDMPSARLTLHSTKLCTEFKIFREIFFFGTKVTSETFLSNSQNLNVTRLPGGTQTKLWTCWQNFDLSRSFERFFFLGLVHGFAVLQ